MKNILLEHIPCDLCGSNNYKIRYRKPDTSLWLNQFEYPVVERINCGLVFVNPRPMEKSMADFYTKNYHENRDGRETGTFYYKFLFKSGGNWQKIYFKKLNIIQKIAGRIGYYFDKIIFNSHWEAKNKKSGIMIVEFQKKEYI